MIWNPNWIFHVSSSMRKSLLFILLISVSIAAGAQDISGSWIMSYIKAKQPVFVMVEQDGELMLEDEIPQDSTIIYSPGLMLLKPFSKDSAVSYSWDGAEKWAIEWIDDEVWFKGERDSLYGSLNAEGRLALSSTLDDRPTSYVFDKLKFERSASKFSIENTNWRSSAEDSFLDGQLLSFKQDSVLVSEVDREATFGEYYIHPIEDKFAVEFVVNAPATYIGIIYFTKVTKRKMEGIFYALVEDGILPKRTKVTLKRQ